MIVTALLLAAGLVLLLIGGELLVRGASRLAEELGMSPMLVGLVVVGLGTSTPELAASVQAAIAGSPGIAVGNIVGSNMFNSTAVIGIAGAVHPIEVESVLGPRPGLQPRPSSPGPTPSVPGSADR